MGDYSSTALPKKLGIKEGSRVAVINSPSDAAALLGPLPQDARLLQSARSPIDVVVLFSTKLADLDRRFDKLAAALSDAGGLWIAWPKKASKIPCELTFGSVQERGLEAGLVDNKSCSIDDSWQALRFVYRLADRPKRSR